MERWRSPSMLWVTVSPTPFPLGAETKSLVQGSGERGEGWGGGDTMAL